MKTSLKETECINFAKKFPPTKVYYSDWKNSRSGFYAEPSLCCFWLLLIIPISLSHRVTVRELVQKARSKSKIIELN